MSLVDSDHVQPARERHGAHYFGKTNHAGQVKPAMIYKYESAGDEGWECECGRTNWEFVKKCPLCGKLR